MWRTCLISVLLLAACHRTPRAQVPCCPADGGAASGGDGGESPDSGAQTDAGTDAGTACLALDLRAPVAYGQAILAAVLADAGVSAMPGVLTADEASAPGLLGDAGVALDPRAESFALFVAANLTWVVGRDPVGAMYGALELAERVSANGAAALQLPTPVLDAPVVPIRAANLFLVLPTSTEATWWFLRQDFWAEYLDLLARARFDVLDLHGMYDLENTIFPNALLYFGSSTSFPNVGAPATDRARNIAMLDTVIDMAAARGIRVALMSYSSDDSLTGDMPGPALTDAQLQQYTREASADVARGACNLWRLGFRIGESGHAASWYVDSFEAGVKDANNAVRSYTRTIGANKADILALVQASAGNDLIVEGKYNGEHSGPPWVVAGGAMFERGWDAHYYSYDEFLTPPTPYTFVFQLRLLGTHRIFRTASLERATRNVATFSMGGAGGFTLEPPHAYFPQEDYYHANAVDEFSPWTFRRDELMYLLYGRLAYDPTTPDTVFQQSLAARVGTGALWSAVQAASDIVPWIQTAHTCGPDCRDFAPELELGGSVAYWASSPTAVAPAGPCSQGYHGPFDSFAIASPFETGEDLLAGSATTRLSAIDVANRVLANAQTARTAAMVPIDPNNPEARDVVRECIALADLGDYFGHKLRAATALAVYAGSASSDYLGVAQSETTLADDAWQALATDTAYLAPFAEPLRMSQLGLSPFHWSEEVPLLSDDPASINALVAQVQANPPIFSGALPVAATFIAAGKAAGPGPVTITISPMDPQAAAWTVTANLTQPAPAGASVAILWKPFQADSDWQAVAATGGGATFQANIPNAGNGAMFAVDVAGTDGGWRYPDPLSGTPYLVLNPR